MSTMLSDRPQEGMGINVYNQDGVLLDQAEVWRVEELKGGGCRVFLRSCARKEGMVTALNYYPELAAPGWKTSRMSHETYQLETIQAAFSF